MQSLVNGGNKMVRALANNSACYTEKPDMGIFMRVVPLYDLSLVREEYSVGTLQKHSQRMEEETQTIRLEQTLVRDYFKR